MYALGLEAIFQNTTLQEFWKQQNIYIRSPVLIQLFVSGL